jgi:hypothetical protein
MAGGRPSGFKAEFTEQAEKLAKLGATDMEIADFFEVVRTEMEYLVICLQLIKEDRRGIIACRKKKRSESRVNRRKTSPSNRIRESMAARMWAALKGRSDGRLFSRLGYSLEDLMVHLEGKFQAGMSWENYGCWHVDHKKPCVLFDLTDSSQFAQCWTLQNLQPLWARDNIQKGAKYGDK